MAISKTSCVAGALWLIVASAFVLTSGESPIPKPADICANFSDSCERCVTAHYHHDVNCTFERSASVEKCEYGLVPDQGVTAYITNIANCSSPKPDPSNSTTTTPEPPTTNATTIPTTTPTPPTTNGTTVPTTTVPTTPNSTTVPTTPTPVPSTNGTTTAAPLTPTTAAPPHGGGMSWASFFGGIVFTAAISSVAYLVWRFYKARQERNYHTFSNPSTF